MAYYDEDEVAEKMDVDLGPHLDLNSKDLAEIKDWEVGEKYTFTVTAKMTQKNESEESTHACFTVKKVTK